MAQLSGHDKWAAEAQTRSVEDGKVWKANVLVPSSFVSNVYFQMKAAMIMCVPEETVHTLRVCILEISLQILKQTTTTNDVDNNNNNQTKNLQN